MSRLLSYAPCRMLLIRCRRSGAGLDLVDAQDGDRLAMTVLAAVIVAAALLEDQHLLAALLLDHRRADRGAGDGRGAGLGLGAFADDEHLAQLDGGAGLARQLLDRDDIV